MQSYLQDMCKKNVLSLDSNIEIMNIITIFPKPYLLSFFFKLRMMEILQNTNMVSSSQIQACSLVLVVSVNTVFEITGGISNNSQLSNRANLSVCPGSFFRADYKRTLIFMCVQSYSKLP